jgi:hypothetical protein
MRENKKWFFRVEKKNKIIFNKILLLFNTIFIKKKKIKITSFSFQL